MNTAQSSMPALAAGFYPTQGRATGVAWMLGMGRFGGIAGSFLVAETDQAPVGSLFHLCHRRRPGLIAAVALFVKQMAHPECAAEHDATRVEAHDHHDEVSGH